VSDIGLLVELLTTAAIEAYLELCHISGETGLISLYEWRERLRSLQLMIEPHVRSQERVASLEIDVIRAAEEAEPAAVPDSSFASNSCDEAPDDGMLHFNPDSKTGLAHYRFKIGDPDDEPSIPHGHYKAQKHPKLDVYQGGVYDKTKALLWKEPTKRMVALWNDQKFRDFALQAIKQYQISYPKHRWRVVNPLRLPRRQRP
jgi:hypothetical protein